MKSAQEISDSTKPKTTHLFGEFLVSKGLLTRLQLNKALEEQRKVADGSARRCSVWV